MKRAARRRRLHGDARGRSPSWKGLLLLLPLVAVTPGPAQGQVLLGILFGDKLATERFHIGLNAGWNSASLSGLDGTGSKGGLMLGLVAEWKMTGNLYLQPELLPFYNTGASSLPPSFQDNTPLLPEDQRSSHRAVNYFEIPLILKYALAGGRLHLGAGPQVGFVLSATDKFTGTMENRTVSSEADVKDQIASFDSGVAFHAEFKIGPSNFSPSVNGRYYLGLTDTIEDNPSSTAVRNRVFSIFASLPIGGSDDVADMADDHQP